MPTTREFKTRSKIVKPGAPVPKKKAAKAAAENAQPGAPQPKRRPGRNEDNPTPMEAVMNSETETPKMNPEPPKTEVPPAEELAAEFEAPADEPKIEIHFAGSELLRSRFPKPFEVAEAVATDWLKDGKFDHLPISHPLANWAAQRGLQKAKELEKKVVESPRFEKAAMTTLTMAMKAQTAFEQLRAKVKR